MLLNHEFDVAADEEQVWAALTDLAAVAECFPGARLNSATGGVYIGEVGFKVGPIGISFDGRAEFLERDSEVKRAVVKAVGKDKRGNGGASATVTMQLSSDGSTTHVSLETDLDVSGKPAQFGRGLLQEVSERLLRQFVNCMEKKLSSSDVRNAPDAPSRGLRAKVHGSEAGSVRANSTAAQVPVRAPIRPKRLSADGVLLKYSDLGFAVALAVGFMWGTVRARRLHSSDLT